MKNNILVVNVNWIGDVIFSSSVFYALREAYPKAKISCLAVPRVRNVLESIPCIDEIIEYDEKGRHRMPWGKLKLIMQLRKKKFDIAFLLHGSLTRALLVYYAGIPERVGYPTKNRKKYLTHIVPEVDEAIHRADYYLQVIESYGVSVKDRKTHLKIEQEVQEQTQQLLKDHGVTAEDFVAVVNVGGNWDLKRWPKEQFSDLVHKLTQIENVKVIIPGGPNDVDLAKEITNSVKPEPIILAGKTDLKQLMAVMQRANIVISADSGPLHLASSVGATTVGLFGPTRPEITGPRGKGKSVVLQKDVGCNQFACYYLECPDNICMQSISVEDVLNVVKEIKN